MPLLTDEQRNAIIEDALEDIKNEVVQRCISDVQWKINFAVQEEVKKTVSDFFAVEIRDELLLKLTEQKGEIVQAALDAASGIAEVIGKSLLTTLEANMAQSWSREKIFKVMFG